MARILLVEDELLIAEDLKFKLEKLGHTVIAQASTGPEAVRKAAELKPDLVLMDVRLHGTMKGTEAARRIRESRPVPVVYITAHAKMVAAATTDHESQFFLSKPFTQDRFESVISAACRLT